MLIQNKYFIIIIIENVFPRNISKILKINILNYSKFKIPLYIILLTLLIDTLMLKVRTYK